MLNAADRVRKFNRDAIYACDPVIGDVGRGIFVRPGVPEFMKLQAVPCARIVTPNQFELEYLAGRSARSAKDLTEALAIVHGTGPEIILVTSYLGEETPDNSIDLLVSSPNGLWQVRTPKLDIEVNGAGDAIAALFLVHFLRTNSPACSASERCIVDLRPVAADGGRGLARAVDRSGAGGIREAEPPVRG